MARRDWEARQKFRCNDEIGQCNRIIAHDQALQFPHITSFFVWRFACCLGNRLSQGNLDRI